MLLSKLLVALGRIIKSVCVVLCCVRVSGREGRETDGGSLKIHGGVRVSVCAPLRVLVFEETLCGGIQMLTQRGFVVRGAVFQPRLGKPPPRETADLSRKRRTRAWPQSGP